MTPYALIFTMLALLTLGLPAAPAVNVTEAQS